MLGCRSTRKSSSRLIGSCATWDCRTRSLNESADSRQHETSRRGAHLHRRAAHRRSSRGSHRKDSPVEAGTTDLKAPVAAEDPPYFASLPARRELEEEARGLAVFYAG